MTKLNPLQFTLLDRFVPTTASVVVLITSFVVAAPPAAPPVDPSSPTLGAASASRSTKTADGTLLRLNQGLEQVRSSLAAAPEPISFARLADRDQALTALLAYLRLREQAGMTWPTSLPTNFPRPSLDLPPLPDLATNEGALSQSWRELWATVGTPPQQLDGFGQVSDELRNVARHDDAGLRRFSYEVRERYESAFAPALTTLQATGAGPSTADATTPSSHRYQLEGVKGELRVMLEAWNRLLELIDAPPPPAMGVATHESRAQQMNEALAVIAKQYAALCSDLPGSTGQAAPTTPVAPVDGAVEFLKFPQLSAAIAAYAETLRFRDQLGGKQQALKTSADKALAQLAKAASEHLNSSTAQAARSPLQNDFVTQIKDLRKTSVEIGLWHRRANVNDVRERELLAIVRAQAMATEQALLDLFCSAIALRLSRELTAWQQRYQFATRDLRGVATNSPTDTAAAANFAALTQQLHTQFKAPGVRIGPGKLMPDWNEADRRFFSCTLTQETLQQRVVDAMRGAPELPAGPITVELRGVSLAFTGNITLSLPQGDKPARPLALTVIAQDVNCNGARFLAPPGASLTLVTHQLHDRPRDGALEAQPPLFAAQEGGRFFLHSARNHEAIRLAYLAGPASAFCLTSDGASQRPWQGLLQSTVPGVAEQLAAWWSDSVDSLVSWHLQSATDADEESLAARLSQIISVPRTVAEPSVASRRTDDLIERWSRQLFDSRVVRLRDADSGRDFHYLISLQNGERLVARVLPDSLEIVAPERGLGALSLMNNGNFAAKLLVRPTSSAAAQARSALVLRRHLPAAIVTEPDWREWTLRWDAPLALSNGQRLEADRVIAWDEQQLDTTLSIASIDHAGVAKLTHALTHLENRLHLQIVERRRDKVVGRITLDLSLRRASPMRKVTLESLESEFRVANQSEFPVRLLATLSPHVRRDGRELAPGRRVPLPDATLTHIDAELDLRGLAPLDLFQIAGDRTTPRTACFAVPGAAEARFPGIDGSPGTGRYIDLDRSRVVIRVRDELGRELPGCARSLGDLARETGQFELRFTLMAGVRCEFQLELYGYDAAADAPATLGFSLPWRDGDGVEHLQQRVGRNELEDRLWRSSQRTVADQPLEAAP